MECVEGTNMLTLAMILLCAAPQPIDADFETLSAFLLDPKVPLSAKSIVMLLLQQIDETRAMLSPPPPATPAPQWVLDLLPRWTNGTTWVDFAAYKPPPSPLETLQQQVWALTQRVDAAQLDITALQDALYLRGMYWICTDSNRPPSIARGEWDCATLNVWVVWWDATGQEKRRQEPTQYFWHYIGANPPGTRWAPVEAKEVNITITIK